TLMRIDNYRIVGAIRFLSSITVACLFVAPCLGETTFQLVNYAPEVGLDAPIFDGSGIALAGDTYVAELYGGKWASSLTPAYYAIATNRVRVPFLTCSGAGYFNTYQVVGIRDP